MSKKIFHVGNNDYKFLPPFVELVKENFNFNEHTFLFSSSICKIKQYKNVKIYDRTGFQIIKYYFSALFNMHKADKIILHGLFDNKLILILFCSPWLLKKCYWIIWGADLYVHQRTKKDSRWKRNEFLRRFVINRIGHLVTYIKGDFEKAQEWYGAKGQHHECIMYLSNVYKELDIPANASQVTNIQVGNSADPSNNHIEALEKLLPYKDDDICIYVPLSYGNKGYAEKVIVQGEKWFGDKFIPLTDFMPFKEYLKFLGRIDIAIFNHKRQQGMGNTIILLGLGKTVYLRSDTTQWQFFKDKNIDVFDVENISPIEIKQLELNRSIVKGYFSKENLIKQYRRVFE